MERILSLHSICWYFLFKLLMSFDTKMKSCYEKPILFNVSPSDIIFEDGYEQLRQWAKSKNDETCYVWARGNLDQLIMDSFEEQLEIKPIWPFQRWRDVRTAIDIFYNTNKGYVKVNYPNFDPDIHIRKHCPTDDCVFDIMQLVYGIEQ